jgi:hypothetical protein
MRVAVEFESEDFIFELESEPRSCLVERQAKPQEVDRAGSRFWSPEQTL